MFLKISKAIFVLTVLMMTVGNHEVFAQEATASHLAAARTALSATKATESFDSILINSSAQLKNRLTAKDPNKADLISSIVDEEALALAARRGDLEGESARLFTREFNEDELVQIANFFNSDAGKKYLDATPKLAQELSKSARIWANGINRDMNENVNKRLEVPNN
ncbi:MAG: DUF2059 domain-containing protein [Rhizobiaceae bacterium]